MKWSLKRDLFALLMIAVYILVSLYFYPRLPEQVPFHFNGQGVADDFGSKQNVVWGGAAMMAAMYLLLTFIPFLDPFRKKIEQRYPVFLLFRDLAMGFSAAMAIITFLSAKDGKLQTELMALAFGALFIGLGNYLPRLPRNFFFGIRSPWTLASETVWYRTHRVSGTLFVLGGILLCVLSLLRVPFGVTMPVVLVPLVVYTSFIYPYFLFRKLKQNGEIDSLGTK